MLNPLAKDNIITNLWGQTKPAFVNEQIVFVKEELKKEACPDKKPKHFSNNQYDTQILKPCFIAIHKILAKTLNLFRILYWLKTCKRLSEWGIQATHA